MDPHSTIAESTEPLFKDWTDEELEIALQQLLKAAPLKGGDFEQRFHEIEDDFTARIATLAGQVSADDISPAEFRTRMTTLIRTQYTEAYRLGASVADDGRATLNDADREALGRILHDELAFLDGFARDLRTGDLTESQISSRASLYANAIRGVYWEARSLHTSDDLYDAYYEARDDKTTCTHCKEAQDNSPYPPSACPRPGAETCEGLDRCRCRIRYELKSATKGVTADLTKLGWDESLHPRDTHGRFTVSGAELGRSIVDGILQGMHDGMTMRSQATHRRIIHELRHQGLEEHARGYGNVVRARQQNNIFTHPRTAFGMANIGIHNRTVQAAPVPEVAHESQRVDPVPPPHVTASRFYTGDMEHRWPTGYAPATTVTTRELAHNVLHPGGGPATFVRAYRNARNAGMTHEQIMQAAADEANRLEPRPGDPFTPQRVEEAVREQYRLSGRTSFSPNAASYESGGRSYEWGTRPSNLTDQSSPTIGRVVQDPNAPRPEPSRPAGEPSPAGTAHVTPPIAGDTRFIRGTGPGGSITSADRILAAHPTGGVNDDVQKLYERDLLKFQQAGGQIIFLKNGDPRFQGMMDRYTQNVHPNLPSDSRHQHGASFMRSNLAEGLIRRGGGVVIALDKNGNPVAAVGFGDMGDELHVGVAGSAGLLPGAGMAMQWGLANIVVESGKSLGSSYLPDAKPAHASWGRRLGAGAGSRWTKDDAKKIASFRPAAPVIQK